MTPPPRKYTEAPGTASSAAEMRPPADDSATATVCLRSLSSAPSAPAMERSFGMARMIARDAARRCSRLRPELALAAQCGDVNERPQRVGMARPRPERLGHTLELGARHHAVLDQPAAHRRREQAVGVGITPCDRVVG